MKERPILMSGPLVREILAGNKTQTRRPIKALKEIDPDSINLLDNDIWYGTFEFDRKENGHVFHIESKYGGPGDQLWVRETWKWEGDTSWEDIYPVGYFFYRADPDSEDIRNWKPSIFMPHRASRITLEIVSIKVERLHNISEEDAKAEGIEPLNGAWPYIAGFYKKWVEIYGKESYESNPWVWAIKFKKI